MSNGKKIIIAGIIVFFMFVSARIFQKETQAQEEPLVIPDASVSAAGEENQKGREILTLLADLKSVRLDESIFSDPVFQSLKDTSVELSAEPKGRPNPFAPIGKDAVLSEDFSAFATTSPRDISFSSEALTDTKTKSKSSGSVIVIPVGGR
jgi:hypothetical protein